MSPRSRAVVEWQGRDRIEPLAGHPTWVLDEPCLGTSDGPPVVLVHGFPTCGWDWRHLVPALTSHRRVLVLDLPGCGSSVKPDRPHRLAAQAEVVVAMAASRGIDEIDLVTHDMGDSIGGEILARDLEGADEGTEDMTALWQLTAQDDGHLLLARLIRYLDGRRRHERRWTGAIEDHPSRSTWSGRGRPGRGPVDGPPSRGRPPRRHDHVAGRGSHFPMLESPGLFTVAVRQGLGIVDVDESPT